MASQQNVANKSFAVWQGTANYQCRLLRYCAKVEGTFKIENGKLTISAEVAATLGIGLGGGVEVEIDFAELAQSIVDAIDEYFKTETPKEDWIPMQDLGGKDD